MQRRLRWAQVDDQEHPASPETQADPAPGLITPLTGPGRERHPDGIREAVTGRGAGWAVAAAMAGAVVGLSVAMATSTSPTVVARPEGPGGLGGSPAGAVRAAVAGGAQQAQAPIRLLARVPQQAPARLRLQVPVRLPVQSPARLLAQPPVAGTLIPAPQSVPGTLVPVTAVAPRSLRLHLRPAQVRIRIRIPASAHVQVRPSSLPGPLGVVVPGPRPAEVHPAGAVTAARLRVVFQRGLPVPAQLVLPANLPGQARMRIQIPARARLTPALSAQPAW